MTTYTGNEDDRATQLIPSEESGCVSAVATAFGIYPIELLELPPELDGSAGINRSPGLKQIAANDDRSAVFAWLATHRDEKTTFESYRKEAERLLLWATVERGKPMSSLMHEDILAYRRFLANPEPTERWVLSGKRKWPRSDRNWRPFAGPLSEASQKQAMTIINSLFSWLVNSGYLNANPVSLSRKRRATSPSKVTRYLDWYLWEVVTSTIESMPKEKPRDLQHYKRVRWMFSLLYLGGLRISEISENTMGCFSVTRERSGVERWWMEIVGKGVKLRKVPATKELMSELVEYRRFNGLPPFPVGTEASSLVLPMRKSSHPSLQRSALHSIVKEVFRRATDALIQRDGPDSPGVETLRLASAHWLRHTAGSHMVEQMDLVLVRDNLGHSNISTTSQYLHTEDDKRHEQTDQFHKLGWKS